MKKFINLSMRIKLILSFGLIWILLGVVIIIAYTGLKDLTKSEKKLYDINFTTANQLIELRAYQNRNRADVLELMLTKDITEQVSIEKSLNDRAEVIDEIIKQLSESESSPQYGLNLVELQDHIDEYRKRREKIVELINSGQIIDAQQLSVGIQGELFDKISLKIYNMSGKANLNTEAQLKQNQEKANLSIMIFLTIGIIAIIFSFIMIFILNNAVAQPLINISQIAIRIASGDLKTVVEKTDRKDEVGVLQKAFSEMVQKLNKSIFDIMEAVNLLGSAASEIMAATTQVASGSAETASAISETTTTVEEVRQAAQLSSQKASRVAENAQQVAQVTHDGQRAVEETVNGIHLIQNQMESIANTIVRLSEQSQQIGGIIASVDDVADQSNLLAVNASIEAAKAGEHGKGFAVVAQEIKNLAQMSKQATFKVRGILSDVQKATTAAVMATEQGSKAVENGVKTSAKAGESIRKLADSTGKAVEAATQIVASSQQQVIGMDQIGLAMNNINQAGTENAASMMQAERSAKDLNDLGQKLKILVDQYKI